MLKTEDLPYILNLISGKSLHWQILMIFWVKISKYYCFLADTLGRCYKN